ncbi:hypothetical protein HDA45_003047 [Amycolatopsis umgeniensis]|uniref:Uncharacterized protein n=1 Tax=Amycolatopsis umgeniensis TaxID=336628 RepID=A0A841B2A1_9PSEU|nr:hypothetical protein [Amycolatopsis umgeniensis]
MTRSSTWTGEPLWTWVLGRLLDPGTWQPLLLFDEARDAVGESARAVTFGRQVRLKEV